MLPFTPPNSLAVSWFDMSLYRWTKMLFHYAYYYKMLTKKKMRTIWRRERQLELIGSIITISNKFQRILLNIIRWTIFCEHIFRMNKVISRYLVHNHHSRTQENALLLNQNIEESNENIEQIITLLSNEWVKMELEKFFDKKITLQIYFLKFYFHSHPFKCYTFYRFYIENPSKNLLAHFCCRFKNSTVQCIYFCWWINS